MVRMLQSIPAVRGCSHQHLPSAAGQRGSQHRAGSFTRCLSVYYSVSLFVCWVLCCFQHLIIQRTVACVGGAVAEINRAIMGWAEGSEELALVVECG